MNYIELLNEFCVQEAAVHMIFFTDFIVDLDVQFQYGWYMIGGVTFVFIFNFYFIFREIFKIIKLCIIRYIKRFFPKMF